MAAATGGPAAIGTASAAFARAAARRLQALARPDSYHALRCALILNGVDIAPLHGWVSAVHTDADMEKTVQAFEKALVLMQEDGCFA